MSCQSNVETYAVVIRCPLKYGAMIKTLAEEQGKTVSVLMGEKVRELVGDRELTEDERKWFDEHLEMNKARRARADKLTKSGYFKHRRRGRPRKPGPRKGWKKNGKILNQA